MITEAEAKEKWCPLARLGVAGGLSGFNRAGGSSIDDGPQIVRAVCCIASACMAWRWHNHSLVMDAKRDGRTLQTAEGWCGQFGGPQ